MRRALRRAGLAALVAVVTIFIPIVHFVVPPLAFLTSIVLLVRSLKQSALIQGGGGPCPQCQQRVELEEQPLQWPIELNCPHCRRSLTIKPAAPPLPHRSANAQKVANGPGSH